MGIIFNHGKLENRINAMYGGKEAFGQELGMTKQRINSRLRGVTEFSQSEIEKAVDLLNIPPEEIQTYFFDIEVYRA
jgi:hypothetical protein